MSAAVRSRVWAYNPLLSAVHRGGDPGHTSASRSAVPWSKKICLGTRACWQRRSPDSSLRPVHGGDRAGIAVPGIDLSRGPAHRSRFVIHNCYVNLRHGEEGPVTAKLCVLATTTGAAIDGGEQP
jgi:hypothetical protein